MNIQINQRYISTMEPELGLGIVISVEQKRFSLNFELSDTIRQYSVFEAPVKRVIFRIGDKIKSRNEKEYLVSDIIKSSGVISYKSNLDIIPEKDISPKLTFESPQQRLLAQIADSTEKFNFRQRTNIFKNKIISSPTRGFVGGRVDLLPHQFYIADKICHSRQKRFFLSDEVGLGKTIETCLVIHRLLITETIERILIIVPSALIHQWLIELFRRFNILSTVVNSDLKNRIDQEGNDIFKSLSPVIISIQDLINDQNIQDGILNSDWDLMVVDEAHHITPNSDEYPIINTLASQIERLLLLTATPELMSEDGQFALLKLIDQDKYQTIEKYRSEKQTYEKVATIADKILKNGNPKKIISDSKFNLPDNLLSKYSNRKIISTLNDLFGIGRAFFRNSRSVIKGFPKREFTLVSISSKRDSSSNISKEVSEWIKDFSFENRHKKTLIICKSIDDANLLHKKLSSIKKLKIAFFTEEMTIIKLDRNAAWFSEHNGASVLVSSEIGSEGRNFQFADYLILPDLPLEPEILEQRIGRLDRIGRNKSVKIIVPAVVNSPTHLLAKWYHNGLNAFEKTLAGGYQTGEKFKSDLSEILTDTYNQIKFTELIEKTKKFNRQINQDLKNGEHKLLEFLSFDKKVANNTIAKIKNIEQDNDLPDFMDEVFDLYQIEQEEFSNSLSKISFDMVTDHAFPVPLMNDHGLLISFDRKEALTREDSEFITIDHPIVTGSIDLILSSEKGNSSFSIFENSGEDGFMLESIFILEPTHNKTLQPVKYLPPQPIRILIDDTIDNVSDIFSTEQLYENLVNGSIDSAFESNDNLNEFINSAIAKSREIIDNIKEIYIKNAHKKILLEYNNEIARIQELSFVSTDISSRIKNLQKNRDILLNIISESPARLDSLRLIQLTQ